MKNMLSIKLVICGLVRNAASNLERNLEKVEELRPHFASLKVIIFENDSTDSTKDILKRYEGFHKKHAHITTADYKEYPFKNGPFSKHRVDLMSKYRNQYLDKLKEFPETDYVLIIDLDVYDFSIDSIFNCFKSEQKWDMVSAFGINYVDYKFSPVFYDIYAYTEENNKKHHFANFVEFEKEQRMLFKKYDKSNTWYKVTSNFNGLAIYTYESLMCGARYFSVPCSQEGVEAFCEHVVFNAQLIDKGFDKLYVNPKLKVIYEKKNVMRHFNGYLKHSSMKAAKRVYSLSKRLLK